jgi:dTDP-4-amino-4,6-dideoxygalactose transaminase
MDKQNSIHVTKSYLPEITEYIEYLKGIWERVYLTNNGPLVIELEERLKTYLNVKHLFLVNNGTIAIQIALKAIGLKGEIITTPFSYVATTSSIVWEGCKPVFADIDSITCNISPKAIIDKITPDTSAILATHVYGNPCEVSEIKHIADSHKLKVIYDAAHAFGTKYEGKSIMEFGDVSTLSFHATKLFHTIEGGAIITNNDDIAHHVNYMRSFGHNGPEDFWGLGINGKNSEFHAAMGLCILPKIEEIINDRKSLCRLYDSLIKFEDCGIERPQKLEGTTANYGYYPILMPDENSLLKVVKNLNAYNIFPRRYFYPSLNHLRYIDAQSAPVSENISRRALCLPLYNGLEKKSIEFISKTINDTLRR